MADQPISKNQQADADKNEAGQGPPPALLKTEDDAKKQVKQPERLKRPLRKYKQPHPLQESLDV